MPDLGEFVQRATPVSPHRKRTTIRKTFMVHPKLKEALGNADGDGTYAGTLRAVFEYIRANQLMVTGQSCFRLFPDIHFI